MRVRWTTDAADDLERICDYIGERRPEAARRVAQTVVERIGTLESFLYVVLRFKVALSRSASAPGHRSAGVASRLS